MSIKQLLMLIQKILLHIAKTKLDESYVEVKDINKSSFVEYFNTFLNNYNDFLDSLSPDKIVCVFNIIMG